MLNVFPLSRFTIKGNSMLPTLKPKMSVISFNWYFLFFPPKQNDLVVANINKRLIIKRIKKINKKEIWLEGDNLNESTDSRTFGWVKTKELIGKIIYAF